MEKEFKLSPIPLLDWTTEEIKKIILPKGQVFEKFIKPKESNKLFVLTNKEIFEIKS